MARKPRPRKTFWAHPTLMQRLRRDFLTGLVVVLPAALTVYVVLALVGFVDRQVMPFVPRPYRPDNVIGVGLVIFIVFTTLVGAIAKGFIGRRVIHLGEQIVDRTPVVRSIYNALKQIVGTVLSQQSTSFKQACLVQYPRQGIWAVAFLSTEAKGEIPGKAGEDDLVSVFLPSTPNPTTGFLLFVPRRDIRILDMSVEDAAKLIISAGLVTPEAKPPAGDRRRRVAAE